MEWAIALMIAQIGIVAFFWLTIRDYKKAVREYKRFREEEPMIFKENMEKILEEASEEYKKFRQK